MFGAKSSPSAEGVRSGDGSDEENYDQHTLAVDVQGVAATAGKYGNTKRGLKSRHIQLIALGGCIGTGLFVGTGSTLSLVGPAPLFMCIDCVCRTSSSHC